MPKAGEATVEQLSNSAFSLFEEFEDLYYELEKNKKKDNQVYWGMLKNISERLDMSRLKDTGDDSDLIAAFADSVGAAYGTFIKLIGMTNRATSEKGADKDLKYLHENLEKLGTAMKNLVTEAGQLNKNT